MFHFKDFFFILAEIEWTIQLDSKEPFNDREWPIYLELPNRGLVCLEFNNYYEFGTENGPKLTSLKTKFMETDLEDTSIAKDCLFLATLY